jgi:hypothetical protein
MFADHPSSPGGFIPCMFEEGKKGRVEESTRRRCETVLAIG